MSWNVYPKNYHAHGYGWHRDNNANALSYKSANGAANGSAIGYNPGVTNSLPYPPAPNQSGLGWNVNTNAGQHPGYPTSFPSGMPTAPGWGLSGNTPYGNAPYGNAASPFPTPYGANNAPYGSPSMPYGSTPYPGVPAPFGGSSAPYPGGFGGASAPQSGSVESGAKQEVDEGVLTAVVIPKDEYHVSFYILPLFSSTIYTNFQDY